MKDVLQVSFYFQVGKYFVISTLLFQDGAIVKEEFNKRKKGYITVSRLHQGQKVGGEKIAA